MKQNIGNADRGYSVDNWCYHYSGGNLFKTWWGLIGVLPIVTGTVRYCPLYVPLKLNTGAPKS